MNVSLFGLRDLIAKPATLDRIDGRLTKVLIAAQERLRDHGAAFCFFLFGHWCFVASCSSRAHLYRCDILVVFGKSLGIRRFGRANTIADFLLVERREFEPRNIDCTVGKEYRRPELRLPIEHDVFDAAVAKSCGAGVAGAEINADLHVRFLPWRSNTSGIYSKMKRLSEI
ncbi:hypothetical protein D3C84_576410 [compost metagenome]